MQFTILITMGVFNEGQRGQFPNSLCVGCSVAGGEDFPFGSNDLFIDIKYTAFMKLGIPTVAAARGTFDQPRINKRQTSLCLLTFVIVLKPFLLCQTPTSLDSASKKIVLVLTAKGDNYLLMYVRTDSFFCCRAAYIIVCPRQLKNLEVVPVCTHQVAIRM